ncbi:MAG: hypothetical protein VKL39_14015 [Leptolyngbyaceae bacterium]|nr:hypothetical protein [Leptolyngbyaceae bacterium]
MSIHLNVQAEVIDISTDAPRKEDIFLVDTNVWLWQTYANSIPSDPRVRGKTKLYTSYLKKARTRGATLAYSGLILAELAHVIEKTECAIFRQKSQRPIKAKEYRHSFSFERANVVAEVESAWKQVEALAISLELTINEANTNAALNRFKTQALDGYDLLLLETMAQANVGQVKVITDDMDYVVVPDIQVFTANGYALQQATQQKKLLQRYIQTSP